MAGARARPLQFSDQTYVAAADLLARAGEIQGRALSNIGQNLAAGLNTITQKKEAQKNRNLRESILDKQLSQRERESLRDEAYRRASLTQSRNLAFSSLSAREADRLAREGMSFLEAGMQSQDPNAQAAYFKKAQEAKARASEASQRSMDLVRGFFGPNAPMSAGRAPSGKT